MNIQKLRQSVNYLTLAISLAAGLTTVSSCSAEPVDTAYSIEENDTSQAYQLGLNYYKGNSVKQDYKEAFEKVGNSTAIYKGEAVPFLAHPSLKSCMLRLLP